MDGEILCEPAGLRNPRNEPQMLSFQCVPKTAGDEKIVTRSSAPARCRARFLNKSDHTDGNRDWPCCVARFAADNSDSEAACRSPQSAIEPSHPCDFGLLWNDKCNQRKLRDS